MIELTNHGKEVVRNYILELEAKRKEILDAGKDTADDTDIPDYENIIVDIEFFGVDDDGEYWNGWNVTDNYQYDFPLSLQYGDDFVCKAKDIVWDTDGDKVDLPTEVTFDKYTELDYIADVLSDMYGFCVVSFS